MNRVEPGFAKPGTLQPVTGNPILVAAAELQNLEQMDIPYFRACQNGDALTVNPDHSNWGFSKAEPDDFTTYGNEQALS